MPKFPFKNYWPSLLLSIVLLVGIGVCLRKLDCLAIEEVRALITIIFGSAASCLLLSFVWLVQRKPLHRPWPNQGLVLGRDVLPSMNPRGRFDSIESNNNSSLVSTISNLELETPPTYEDALIYSKPLNWRSIGIDLTCGCPAAHNQEPRASHLDFKDPTPSSDHSCRCGFSRTRKISFIQLDVSQLSPLSSSPPKYYELQLGEHLPEAAQSQDKSTTDR